MIVDCHTQMWDASARLGRSAGVAETVHADAARHLEAIGPVDRAIVLGFKSQYLEAEISNQFISDYVRRCADKVVGFAGIDPTERDCVDEVRHAQEALGLKGITVSPALQNFHPSDTRAMRVYEECAQRNMPVVFELDPRNHYAKLEFARPMLLDEVAREYPTLRVVIAHFGYPWIDETIVLLAKHPHLYTDIAGLLRQPWRTYNALMTAHEYGVIGKLLFASDFPYRKPAACIEMLYSLNQLSHGTNLPAIPREQLRGIIERDALSLLGITRAPTPTPRPAAPRFIFDES